MAKNSEKQKEPFFSHDINARNSTELLQIKFDLGHEGKSVFWDVVEFMHSNEFPIEFLPVLAKNLETTTELLEKCEKSLFGVTQTFIQNKLVPLRDILNARYEEFAAIHADPGLAERNSISTGYAGLDFKLGGFKRGDLVILAARPSMGKTAMALNFAQNVAKK